MMTPNGLDAAPLFMPPAGRAVHSGVIPMPVVYDCYCGSQHYGNW